MNRYYAVTGRVPGDDEDTLLLVGQHADVGYLQYGTPPGPFRTESVRLKHEAPDNWFARFEGKWRKVHVQVNRTYIVYRGERITIQVDGV